jgi:hypothetical protein
MKEDVSVDKGREKLAALPAKQMESEQSMPPPGVAMERKREEYALGVAMKESRAPEAISLMQKATISMRVANINTAVGEVEKLLVKYDAKKIVKQMPGGKAILTAELKTKKMKDLIAQLKTIGRVEEKGLPMDAAEGDIAVVIEIINN